MKRAYCAEDGEAEEMKFVRCAENGETQEMNRVCIMVHGETEEKEFVYRAEENEINSPPFQGGAGVV